MRIPETPDSPTRIVIIGAGQAGGWAARTLRDEKYAGSITLIGEEKWPPHERPPLSKGLLAGHVLPDSTYLFPPNEWSALDIDWRNDCRVLSIDRNKRIVTLEGGDIVAWDRLILCTGGRARPLSIPGLDVASITLRTIDDSIQLQRQLRSTSHLLIIGGGWIGLEVAATARQLGVEVTLIEAAPQLCMRSLPANVAQLLASLHEQNGVRILLDTTIENAEKDAQGSITAWLSTDNLSKSGIVSGKATRITVDTVFAGIGMVPNDGLARASGIACANGILVDQYCRTSDPFVFSAGDVAVNSHRGAASPFRLESWQNAQQQGIAAARSVLGLDAPYNPMPWFWSDQFDVNVQILGIVRDADQVIVRGSYDRITPEDRALFFYLRHGVLHGVIGLNAGRDIRVARRLIERATILDTEKLADPAVQLKSLA